MDYIDVSKWQDKMNFEVTKKSGVSGVILRAAYHISTDKKLDEFYHDAVKAGYKPAVYLFSIAHYASEAKNFAASKALLNNEINHLLSILKGKKVEFAALDLELEDKQTTNLTKAEMTELINYFDSRMKATGITPYLYCSIAWLFDRMLPEKIASDLWIAYYYDGAKKESFPATKWGELMNKVKDKIRLWQYSATGDGKQYGANATYVDLNYAYPKVVIIPTPKPTPVQPTPTPVTTYTVKAGDNLTNIAKANGIKNWQTLYELNKAVIGSNPNILKVGQVLKLSATATTPTTPTSPQTPASPTTTTNPKKVYIVKDGDSLSSIAKKLGLSSWKVLYEQNKSIIGSNPNLIKTGQKLTY